MHQAITLMQITLINSLIPPDNNCLAQCLHSLERWLPALECIIYLILIPKRELNILLLSLVVFAVLTSQTTWNPIVWKNTVWWEITQLPHSLPRNAFVSLSHSCTPFRFPSDPLFTLADGLDSQGEGGSALEPSWGAVTPRQHENNERQVSPGVPSMSNSQSHHWKHSELLLEQSKSCSQKVL